MKDKELHKLSREELLELLLEETKENQKNPEEDGPTADQISEELHRVRYRSRYLATLRSTISTLIVVAAVAVLVATIWMPVLQIYGSSMTPTLQEGDVIVSLRGSKFEKGDLVAFYLGNKILVKRCIADQGSGWISMRMAMSMWTVHSWMNPI